MRALCVIPARIGSKRLPNKPLQLIAGQSLIAFATRRILTFGLFDDVVVATDHPAVAEALTDVPVRVVMTSGSHTCGTERVAEVAGERDETRIVNIQGDEAAIPKAAVQGVLGLLESGSSLATAAADLTDQQRRDEHTTKVAVSSSGAALGFHRRLGGLRTEGAWVGRHIGIYGYQRDALRRWASTRPTNDEVTLGLEQLRPLSYGAMIAVARVDDPGPSGVDTLSDLEAVEMYMSRSTERVHA